MSILARIRNSVPQDKSYLYTLLPVFAVIGALISLMPVVLFVGAVLIMMQPVEEQQVALVWLAWTCPVVLIVWMIYSRIETLSMNQLAFEVGHTVRRKVIEKCQSLSIGRLRGVKTSNIVQILTEHAKWLEGFTSHSMSSMVADYGIPVLLLVVLFFVDWRPALIVIATMAMGLMIMKVLGKQVSKVIVEREEPVDAMNDRLSDFVKGMPVIRSFGLTKEKEDEFSKTLEDLDVILKRSLRKEIPLLASAGSALELGLAFALMFNGWLVVSGNMDATRFVLATLLTILIFLPALQQVGGSVMLRFAQDAEKAISTFFGEPDLMAKGNKDTPKDNFIRFEDVSFAYPGAPNKQVLAGASFDIPIGGVTAIVGPSGAGKSTLLNLIARFYDPVSGSIQMGGVDLRDMQPRDLLSKMSVVLQDEHIFNDTIAANIRIGRPDASDDEVIEAAKTARCHDFISQFPQGYDTLTGAEGKALSGGERQRIAIARAILKNGPIVVLDEATAAIDPINGAAIQEAIGELSRGKTFIVIAHHLSAVAQADQIVVVNNGSVESVGQHDQLLNDSHTYKSLWEKHRSSLEWSLA